MSLRFEQRPERMLRDVGAFLCRAVLGLPQRLRLRVPLVVLLICAWVLIGGATARGQGLTITSASDAHPTPVVSPVYIGGGILGGMNFHTLNVPIYRNDTFCGVFTSANSILPTGFLTFETPLGDPASSLWLAPRVHLAGLGALITAPAADPSRARNPVDSSLVAVTRVHHLDASILSAGVDLFVKYPLTSRLFAFGGPSVSYLVKRDAVHTELITDPAWAVFSDTKSQTRTLASGAIPNASSVYASGTVGASLDVPLSEKVMLAPELSVTLPLSSIRSDYSWHVTTVSLGAAIKFNVAREPAPLIVAAEPPPLPPPAPRPKSEITASVKIIGVDRDSTGAERETAEPQLRVEEFVRLESYPTLNYVFFDSASTEIPARYHAMTGSEASTFDPKSLSGRTSLDVYHDVLNILGKRLSERPSTKITLTGTGDGIEAATLAGARAEAVAKYLETVWKIDPKRIRTEGIAVPRNASNSESQPGAEENRRVELTTSDASLLDPQIAETIDRTMNPPKIRLKTSVRSALPLVKNTLRLDQGSRGLAFFNSAVAVQDWRPAAEDLPRTDTAIVARLMLQDSLGAEAEASDSAHLEQITIKKKREERLKDKIIEHYNLITFDFDKAELDARSRRVIAEIAKSVTPNDHIIIRGYTDMTGDRAHNQQLSEQRAKAVEAALHEATKASSVSATYQTQGEGMLNLVDNRLPEGRFLSRTVFVELEKPVQ